LTILCRNSWIRFLLPSFNVLLEPVITFSADIALGIRPKQLVTIFFKLENEHASDVFEEIDPSEQRDLVSSLRNEKAAF
jgi:Mg/Co/Ni transporter MgtE